MKKVLLAVSVMAFMLFTVNFVFADTVDGYLQIPKAAHAPVIDGDMDDIWYSASFEIIQKEDGADTMFPDDLLDLCSTVRVMWDANNLYIFLTTIDDVKNTSAANTYEDDGFEFYFDANNSKGTAYDGQDDIQLRINPDETGSSDIDTGYGTGANWAFDQTAIQFAIKDIEPESGDAYGWTEEIAIPLAGLQIEPEVGSEFGFDVQRNEDDDGTRGSMQRWWGTDNNAWQNASFFGNAVLTGYVCDDYMKIPKTKAAPVIDGDLDAAWTENSALMHAGKNNIRNGATVPSEFNDLLAWDDVQLDFRVMWDDAAFYVWMSVVDDIVDISATGGDHLQDGIELYLDGDNSKGTAYDTNDIHWSWQWSEDTHRTPALTEVFAWGEPTGDYTGYNFECMIPADQIPFTMEDGAIVGFDVQVNDNENAARENMFRWWGDDNMAWQQPVLFGTAEFSGPIGTAVKAKNTAKPANFSLAQNYPNPFNPTTNIEFSIQKQGTVKLNVYDILGNEVAQLANGSYAPGTYVSTFDGSSLASGVYFYKLETANNTVTKRMMLVK